tara:strand:- start:1069 stop:1452 length:384 start_codon:yes stop_codon:yes gene_type:complete
MKKKIESIEFKKFRDKGGELIFIESKKIFKSGFKRFFVVKANKKVTRGNHSHYKCTQILFCLNGKILVLAYKKNKNLWMKYKLEKNSNYLIVPPNNYLKIKYMTSNSILGVLCDRYYDPKDYNYKKN